MAKAFGELALIRQIRSAHTYTGARKRQSVKARARAGIILGIGDDCAILRPPRGHEILVTTDFSLEGRHFLRGLHSPESIGHRVLARGLSDLAAMGAKPLAAFLSLALPPEIPATPNGCEWLARFFSGFNALASACSVPLAGGDTSESPSPNVLADIVLLGSAPPGRALRRSTALAGDALYVTGHLGGSAAEFAALQRSGRLASGRNAAKRPDPNPHPHLYPLPRLSVGHALLRRELATACIDISDGLSTDIAHLCQESHLGAEISAAALPIHPLAAAAPLAARAAAAAGKRDPLALALHGGEDYELLFAAPSSMQMPKSISGIRITRVGTLTRGRNIMLIDKQGHRTQLKAAGWEHFTHKR